MSMDKDETPIWGRPIRALLAEADTDADTQASLLADLDFMLIAAESMSELQALAWWRANRLLVEDADAPRARGWLAFVRTLDVVRAEVFLEVPPDE